MAKKSNRKTEVIHPKHLHPYAGLPPEDTTKQNISSKINWNIRRLKGMQAQLLQMDADLRLCQIALLNFLVEAKTTDVAMPGVIARQRGAINTVGPSLAKLIQLTYTMQEILGEEVMGKETLEDIEREKDHGPF